MYVHPNHAFYGVILCAYKFCKWLVAGLRPALALFVCYVACCMYSIALASLAVATQW